MGRRRHGRKSAATTADTPPPLPLDPIDLLAGLAPDVELDVDHLPAGIAGATMDTPMQISVAEVGKQLRSGDPTVRRLIRTPGIGSVAGDRRPPGAADLAPARPTPDKPGE